MALSVCLCPCIAVLLKRVSVSARILPVSWVFHDPTNWLQCGYTNQLLDELNILSTSFLKLGGEMVQLLNFVYISPCVPSGGKGSADQVLR